MGLNGLFVHFIDGLEDLLVIGQSVVETGENAMANLGNFPQNLFIQHPK